MERIRVIDSHTGGEPTRVVIEGFPDLGGGPMSQRLQVFSKAYDRYRRAIVCEPRGSGPLVGALVQNLDSRPGSIGVLFFNTEGALGMCGHGMIGVVETLKHLGHNVHERLSLQSPVGEVVVRSFEDGTVEFDNVPSYRFKKDVRIDVPRYGSFSGDIAYGGNWFYLVKEHGYSLGMNHVDELTQATRAMMRALGDQGIFGDDGAKIDHIELFGPSQNADAKNFVLCPGGAYDRSPCGTGTSAKLACLAEEGTLAEGAIWRQESMTGSIFEGKYHRMNGDLIPSIRGRAFVTAESTLLLDPNDPNCWGIPE